MGEERWSAWLTFRCSNHVNHPADSQDGVAVLTNPLHSDFVFETIGRKVCSVCGEPFDFVGQETALIPFLQHDIERFRNAGYNVMKDEEVLWKDE